jgi:hypothetical protein
VPKVAGKTGDMLSGELQARQRLERKAELEPEAKKIFAEVDADGSGLLDAAEMKQLAARLARGPAVIRTAIPPPPR